MEASIFIVERFLIHLDSFQILKIPRSQIEQRFIFVVNVNLFFVHFSFTQQISNVSMP
jgi:hypothetical protein